MKDKLIALLLRHKNVILYIFFGVLTTLVNIITYYIAVSYVKLSMFSSVIIAWILAVFFAYLTNRQWVFGSSKNTQKQVCKSREEKSGRHETLDVAVVRNEAVHELSYRIHKKKSGSDDAEFSRRKHSLINQRLLHDTETHPAHVIEAIRNRSAPESLVSQRPVFLIDLLGSDLLSRRLAYSEK